MHNCHLMIDNPQLVQMTISITHCSHNLLDGDWSIGSDGRYRDRLSRYHAPLLQRVQHFTECCAAQKNVII